MLSADFALAGEQIDRHPALTDPLTGLANRLHFGLVYRYAFTAGDRGMAFTMMLLSCGAQSNEEIGAVGQGVQDTTRAADLVSHVGGGRFVAILVGTNLSGARIAADRIEGALADIAPSRVCVGIAAYDPSIKDPAVLLNATDEALMVSEAGGGGIELR